MRNVRNAFAHAKQPITFETAEVLIRSPATVKNIYDRMTNPTAKEYRELSREFARDFPGKKYKDISPLEMKRAAMYALVKLMQNPQVEDMLNGMNWTVYEMPLPELSFFTSDRPVIIRMAWQFRMAI